MTAARENKSKLRFFLEGKEQWKPETPAKYMNKLTRKQTSNIFKTRTRMIQVKDNYRNGHSDLTCRACGEQTETQKHVLYECEKLHPASGGNNINNDKEPENNENHMTNNAEKTNRNTDYDNKPQPNSLDIFTENADTLKEAAIKIMNYLTKLNGK